MRRFVERRGIYVQDRGAPVAFGGGGGAPPAPSTPATIMGASCVAWWRADLGNTIATDGNWVDQVSGLILAQSTADSRPTQNAGGGPNSTDMMTLDGTDDSLAVALVRAAPGTTPAIIWWIFRQLTWAVNDPIFNDAAGTMRVAQIGSSPGVSIFCGTGNQCNNNNAALNTWVRGKCHFTNSTSDLLRLLSTTTTASVSSGNTAGTQFLVGRNGGSTAFANYDLAEVALFNAAPSAGQDTDLDAYVTARYGEGLV